MTTITSVATFALTTFVLTACGAAQSAEQSPARDADRLVEQAQQYVGDPWEKRFRQQFWKRQHIHDSWNRCHVGENAPRPAGCDGTSLTPRG